MGVEQMSVRRMPSGMSPSSLASYLKCPRSWAYEKVWRLPTGTGYAATAGTAVHRVFELLFQLPPTERTRARAHRINDDLVVRVHAAATTPGPAWLGDTGENELAEDVRQVVTNLDEFVTTVRKGIDGYFEMGGQPDKVVVIGTEVRLKDVWETSYGPVPVRGIVDRVNEGPDFTAIIDDWKNGGYKPEYGAPDYERSMLFYSLLWITTGHAPPSLARLLYVTAQHIHKIVPTPEAMDAVRETTGRVWAEANAAFADDAYKSKTGPLCGYCPFLLRCEPGIDEVRDRARRGWLKGNAPAWDVVSGLRDIGVPKAA